LAAAHAARASWPGAGCAAAPTLLGGTPTHFLEREEWLGRARLVLAGFGWLRGGWRDGCRATAYNTRQGKAAGRREASLGEPVPVRGVMAGWSAAALHCRCCMLSEHGAAPVE